MSAHRLNVSRDGRAVILIGPYDEDLVAMLKDRIPYHARQWKSVAKLWRIDLTCRSIVEQILDELDARDEDESWDDSASEAE